MHERVAPSALAWRASRGGACVCAYAPHGTDTTLVFTACPHGAPLSPTSFPPFIARPPHNARPTAPNPKKQEQPPAPRPAPQHDGQPDPAKQAAQGARPRPLRPHPGVSAHAPARPHGFGARGGVVAWGSCPSECPQGRAPLRARAQQVQRGWTVSPPAHTYTPRAADSIRCIHPHPRTHSTTTTGRRRGSSAPWS